MASNGRYGCELHVTTPPQLVHQLEYLSETASADVSSSKFTRFVHSDQNPTHAYMPEAERTRAKRKRTSPADHSFLEAEYQRNPKPDKAARTSIVQRVALNDKEVQIWFQNRRQVTRRKSRPLLPHEIFSSFHSSQENVHESASTSFESTDVPSRQRPIPTSYSSVERDTQLNHYRSSASERGLEYGISPASSGSNQVGRNANSDRSSSLSEPTESTPLLINQTTVNETGYSRVTRDANQTEDRAGLSTSVDTESISDLVTRSHSSHPSRISQRTVSSMRLSTSLDGEAQVLLGTGDTPSPPGKPLGPVQPSQRFVPLTRSKSAVEFSSQGPSSFANSSSLLPRSSVPGRSRDARTWEFYCDSDARNALSVQAEQEKKGSAHGLLGLIRSGSANSKMSSTPLNRHSSQPKHGTLKRKGTVGGSEQRPKIARTTSSAARLQTVGFNEESQNIKKLDGGPKNGSKKSRHQHPSGDSDKENWEPGTQLRNTQRRTIGEHRKALYETTQTAHNSMRLENLLNRDTGVTRRRKGKEVDDQQEKENIAIDHEVSEFMGEARAPRQEDDLDCVQHLLSLSQGAWQ